jgi:hypothetical protein
MRTFYARSYWFWVISRILFVLLFVISIAQIASTAGPSGAEILLANTAMGIGTLVIGTLAILEMARSKKPTWLRLIGGIFMSLFALALIGVLLFANVKNGLHLVLFLFILWTALAGLRDLTVRG